MVIIEGLAHHLIVDLRSTALGILAQTAILVLSTMTQGTENHDDSIL